MGKDLNVKATACHILYIVKATIILVAFFAVCLFDKGIFVNAAEGEVTFIDKNENVWTYVVMENDNLMITGCTMSKGGSLNIPETINGKTVTKLGEYVFKQNSLIKSVTMPSTIVELGRGVFYNCINLEKVVLSPNVKEIPISAFSFCTVLKTVDFNGTESLNEIGGSAFGGTSIEYIRIPDSVTSIGYNSFANINKVKSLKAFIFPAGMTTLGSDYSEPSYFMNSPYIKYVYIPSTATKIYDNALLIDRGKQLYVPKIYGFEGSDAQDIAKEHGLSFTALDSEFSGIKYELSYADGVITRKSDGQKKEKFTNVVVGEEFTVSNLENNNIPSNKYIYGWKAKTEITSTNGTSTKVYRFTDVLDGNSFIVDKPAGAGGDMLNELIENLANPGTYTYSGKVTFEPILKGNTARKIKVNDGTADKTKAKEGDVVTITANNKESEGLLFSHWKWTEASNIKTITEITSPGTFEMPDNDVELTAVYKPMPTYDIKVSIRDRTLSEKDLATVTLNTEAGYKGQLITGTVSINKENRGYNICKDGCGVNGAVLKWTSDTEFEFIMPEKATIVQIMINGFVIDDSDEGIVADLRYPNANLSFFGYGYVYQESFNEIISYLISKNEIICTDSDEFMNIDLDKDSSPDISYNASSGEVRRLDTNSVGALWNYKLQEEDLDVISTKLAEKEIWKLYKGITVKFRINSVETERLKVDLTSGYFNPGSNDEFSFELAIPYLVNQELVDHHMDEEGISYVDLDKDGKDDISVRIVDNTFTDLKVLESHSMSGLYKLPLDNEFAEYAKDKSDFYGHKEYTTNIDVMFPAIIENSDLIPTPTVEPTAKPSQTPTGSPDITGKPDATPVVNAAPVLPTITPTPVVQPMSKNDENVPFDEKEQALLEADTDKEDMESSKYRILSLRAVAGKNRIKLKWKKVKGADGYTIYSAPCGSKMKKLVDLNKASLKSYTDKKLKKGTFYKYIVVAWRNTPAGRRVISTSKSVHSVTDGGKKGNPKSIWLEKSRITLNVGKKKTIKAKVRYKKKSSVHVAKLRFESGNEKVATVDSKGRIKAVSKGRATIYLYAQDGLCRKVVVTVK